MYTRGANFRYLVETQDGQTRKVDVENEVGPFWSHVYYGSTTPTRLCETDSTRRAVIRYRADDDGRKDPPAVFQCS